MLDVSHVCSAENVQTVCSSVTLQNDQKVLTCKCIPCAGKIPQQGLWEGLEEDCSVKKEVLKEYCMV